MNPRPSSVKDSSLVRAAIIDSRPLGIVIMQGNSTMVNAVTQSVHSVPPSVKLSSDTITAMVKMDSKDSLATSPVALVSSCSLSSTMVPMITSATIEEGKKKSMSPSFLDLC